MLFTSRIATSTVFAVWAAAVCFAQSGPVLQQEDLHTVTSPDGAVQFQIFVGQPVVEQTAVLPRMAYRVLYQGKPLLETSFLGFELRAQNPVGEKPGLNSFESGAAKDGSGKAYNWGIAHFLQNGSQGRLYDVEMRAYDTGVAFRYFIPWSAPMEYILLEGENTEFQFPAGARSLDAKAAIADLAIEREFPLPFTVEQPGLPTVALSQSFADPRPGTSGGDAPGSYAPVTLRHDISSIQGPTMVTQLGRLKDKPWIAVDSKPPFTTPWRVIAIAEPGTVPAAPLR
jgi:hypothetical protein